MQEGGEMHLRRHARRQRILIPASKGVLSAHPAMTAPGPTEAAAQATYCAWWTLQQLGILRRQV